MPNDAYPNASWARARVWLGILCFAFLIYLTCALNLHWPGERMLATLYELGFTHRSGSPLVWITVIAGFALIGTGLRNLGIADIE